MMRWVSWVCVGLAVLGGIVARAQPLPASPAEIPAAPRGERSFRVVFMSDFNGPYGSTTYRETVHQAVRLVTEVLKPEVVLSAGDLVAGQKRGLTEEQIRAMWAGFEQAVVTPLREAGIPFLPVPGNHDASGYPAFAAEREAYARHFREVSTRPVAEKLRWVEQGAYPFAYAAEYKSVGLVAMDITTLEPLGEDHWDRLRRQLDALGESGLKVVVSHIPPYPVTHGRERETIPPPDDDRMVELLAERGVGVWVTGHHHGYYKGRAVGAGRAERARGGRGLMLVSLNCCGDGPRRLIGTAEPQPQSLVVMDVEDGKLLRVFAVTTDGKVVDETRLPETLVHGNEELLRWDLPATRPVTSEREERRP